MLRLSTTLFLAGPAGAGGRGLVSAAELVGALILPSFDGLEGVKGLDALVGLVGALLTPASSSASLAHSPSLPTASAPSCDPELASGSSTPPALPVVLRLNFLRARSMLEPAVAPAALRVRLRVEAGTPPASLRPGESLLGNKADLCV